MEKKIDHRAALNERFNRRIRQRKRHNFITAVFPAVFPLLFYPIFMLVDVNLFFEDFLINNIHLIREFVNDTDSALHKNVMLSGYLFTVIYIIIITPYLYKYSHRTEYIDSVLVPKMKKRLLISSAVLLLLTYFCHFVDHSAMSERGFGLFIIAFSFWPAFFYIVFLMLIYAIVFIFAFMNTKFD